MVDQSNNPEGQQQPTPASTIQEGENSVPIQAPESPTQPLPTDSNPTKPIEPISYSQEVNQERANWLKPSRWVLIVMILAAVGMCIYLWGSQYYYPSNYLSATGQVEGKPFQTSGIGWFENNYYINFTTQQGQKVTYKYQAILSFGAIGSTLKLHYNASQPTQVRIKPPLSTLISELVISLILIPAVILLISKGKLKPLFGRPGI